MDGSSTDKARVIWGQEARRYYEYKDQHEAWQRLGVVELEMFGRVSEVTTRQIADTRERMNRALAEACYWHACQHPALETLPMDDIARLAFLRWRVETGRVRQYFIRESVLDIVREESHA